MNLKIIFLDAALLISNIVALGLFLLHTKDMHLCPLQNQLLLIGAGLTL